MRLESDTRSISGFSRAVFRSGSDKNGQRATLAQHRHDVGDEIAALDEHWVFRKTR